MTGIVRWVENGPDLTGAHYVYPRAHWRRRYIPGGEGMFTTGLSATGAEPATHYISSGTMPQEIVEAVADLAEVSDMLPMEAMQAAGLALCDTSD